jgi:hypothetical protein
MPYVAGVINQNKDEPSPIHKKPEIPAPPEQITVPIVEAPVQLAPPVIKQALE